MLTALDKSASSDDELKYKGFSVVMTDARAETEKLRDQAKASAALANPGIRQAFDNARADIAAADAAARLLNIPDLSGPLLARIRPLSNLLDAVLVQATDKNGKGDDRAISKLVDVSKEARKIKESADACLGEADPLGRYFPELLQVYRSGFDQLGVKAEQDISRISNRKWQRDLAARMKPIRKRYENLTIITPDTFPAHMMAAMATGDDLLGSASAVADLAGSAVSACHGHERKFIKLAADTFPALIGDDAEAMKAFKQMQDMASQADRMPVDDVGDAILQIRDAYKIYAKLKAGLEQKVAKPVIDKFNKLKAADGNSPEARMASTMPQAQINQMLTEVAMGQAIMGVNAKALSPGELVAIQNYTISSGFDPMNRYERNKGAPAGQSLMKPGEDANAIKIWCDECAKALKKLPVWKGGVLRRIETQYPEAENRYKKSNIVVLQQFWSTAAAGTFYKSSNVIEIYVTGKSGRYIAPLAIGTNQPENEVTFVPGTKLLVTGGTAKLQPNLFVGPPHPNEFFGRVEMEERA
jgi:hypothetical protein